MTRPRAKPIKVFVTDDERAAIMSLASSANLSLSAYLRAAGLNQRVRSILDIEAVAELSKVNGNLGRIAELLTESPLNADWTIRELRELQTATHQIMGKVVR